ncbi:MAG: hypothetical protein EOM10_02025 [Opitutae bacterium]|jgi:hypothetical protein|nr:hypothetical protein [Kiritimatiellia bacterium]MDD4118241.1 hypothetical protein [Kiritimatiellia bacterium]NCC92054.1 hypothetical protein [Opitutae bacterium]
MGSWYDERREAQARAYDRAQAVLFLVRFALLFALAAVFWLSGWSRALAAGLRAGLSFPFGWALVHAAFVALAVFGYEAVLFPLSVLAGYSLERVHGRLETEFGAWLRGYLGTLMLEMGLATAGFTGLYALMRLFPSVWWVWATGAYAVLVAGLGECGPSQLLPRVRPPVPVRDESLEAELRRIGEAAGLEITGVAWWDFEHQEDLEDVRLTGAGRRRRVVYSEWAWRRLGRREQVFLAARHMAWHRHGAAWAAQAMHIALAAAVFLGAAAAADRAARAAGLSGAAAPAAFPFLVTALFGLAALAGLAAHAVVRRLELRADRFAIEHAGGPDALRTCLEQQFRRAPFALDAPLWQVLLLHRMPTPACRLARAESCAGKTA